jgi:hypothetical protein
MAWIPLYLVRQDLELLNDWLNKEEEIAFLVKNGAGKWIAKKEYKIIDEIGTQTFRGIGNFPMANFIEYNLWHIPSGQLPLIGDGTSDTFITDPWAGWTENRQGYNHRVPYFGSGHPGIISLQIRLADDGEIPKSSFGWIGNHYKMIGRPAEKSTELFWNKLRRMVKKVSIQVPTANRPNWKKEVFAFPIAFNEIENGRACSLN